MTTASTEAPATTSSWAASGNDRIQGADGKDVIEGGDGRDTIDGGSGADRVDGGAGNDTIRAGHGDDVVDGGPGADVLEAGSGNDVLRGGAGADRMAGGSGDDTMTGGAGADRIDGENGRDHMRGGAGRDRLLGGAGVDRIRGDAGDDRIRGGESGDVLDGGAGNDTISGDGGRDSISGGPGDDRIDAADRSPAIGSSAERGATVLALIRSTGRASIEVRNPMSSRRSARSLAHRCDGRARPGGAARGGRYRSVTRPRTDRRGPTRRSGPSCTSRLRLARAESAGRPVPRVSRDDSARRRAASVCARVGPRGRRDRPLVAWLGRGSQAGCRARGDRLDACACACAWPCWIGHTAARRSRSRCSRRRAPRLPDTSASVRDPRFSSHPRTVPSAPASVRVAGEQQRARSGSRWRPSPGYVTLPQRCRRLVSGRARHSQRTRERHVPDPAGLLAERLEGPGAAALPGRMGALDRADERIGCRRSSWSTR